MYIIVKPLIWTWLQFSSIPEVVVHFDTSSIGVISAIWTHKSYEIQLINSFVNIKPLCHSYVALCACVCEINWKGSFWV